jgi:hypothetical protein
MPVALIRTIIPGPCSKCVLCTISAIIRAELARDDSSSLLNGIVLDLAGGYGEPGVIDAPRV